MYNLRSMTGGLLAALLIIMGVAAMCSEDAYVKQDSLKWIMGTATVERVVTLRDGRFLLESYRNKTANVEMITGEPADEFFYTADDGVRISSSTPEWKLVESKTIKHSLGELQLDITLQRNLLIVTKSYVVYPKSSIVREWVTFKNAGSMPVKVIEPGFLNISAKLGDPASLDFNWMTGGECLPGTWELRTEKLGARPRTFDSYEPFPIDRSKFPGDGIDAKIMLNDKQIWPSQGWQYVPDGLANIPFDITADVNSGDRLVFIVNMHRNYGFDTTSFDPTISYNDGESHTASKEFTSTQGKNNWRYQYIEPGGFVDLVYYTDKNQWRAAKDHPLGIPFIGQGNQHPDTDRDSARVWTANKSGHIHITGSVCNTGNGAGNNSYGFRPGSGTYAPWYTLYNKQSKTGLLIGWDYFGHWASSFTLNNLGTVTGQLRVAGHKQTLAPGESFSTPKSFTGVFTDDLDNAGNECLDWQYRYMWDYTRDGWFPAIRMLGFWWNGTTWGQSDAGWTGGKPDWSSCFRKIFRVADLMSYVGADVYHRDWGWWDKAGDWNGPDFRTTGNYLRKHGMGQLIYAFIYTVDPSSKVAQEHPDWVVNGTLDMSKPEVVEYLKGQLDIFVNKWGTFEWRNDSFFTTPVNGDDTPILKQDEGFRKVMKDFLDKHPDCAFQAVNGGGNYGGYDYTRMCSSFSFSDGADGLMRNYYASLLFPPDKTSDIPDAWNPAAYDKSTWRGLLCINFDMTGDTWDPAKLEGVRELIDIYHYLHSKGVVGRWVKVYRPIVVGDNPTMYMQRLSGDRERGIIIPKHQATESVTIIPKGLVNDMQYTVTFHESGKREKRTGTDLMVKGITIEKMIPGELIYLNLPMHPGSKLDKELPGAPSNAEKQIRSNMGYPGIELTWNPGTDNNWISYYEILRDGEVIDKVSKGAYYFDHSAGADLASEYKIRTVDGSGNRSTSVAASGLIADRSKVYDDAVGAGITYTGNWDHKTDLMPAHNGTISASGQIGDSAEITFEGSSVMWFSKLGADCGKASVSIDGGTPEVVDTFSADDIWGVCVYRKTLQNSGKHTLRITVTENKNRRAKGNLIYVDAIRVEP